MSNRYVAAFNTAVRLQQRSGTIQRYGELSEVEIVFAPANYIRNLAAMEEVTITGREFVIPKFTLDAVGYPVPEKGDIVTDAELGENTLTSVEELVILGAIAGYRVRTS